MAIALHISLQPKHSRLLDGLGNHFFRELKKQFGFMGKSFLAKIRANCRGPIVNKRTGKLIRSMKFAVGGSSIDNLFCQWSANTPYAAQVHEGFKNRPVTAKQKANSVFLIPGVGFRRFAKDTKSVTFAPHPYLTKTIRDNRERIHIYIKTAIRMSQQKGRMAA